MSDGYHRGGLAGSGGSGGTVSVPLSVGGGVAKMPAPSGDTTGATDTAAFKAALNGLPTVTVYATPSTKAGATATFHVGTIYLQGAPANVWNDQVAANNTGTPYYFGTSGSAAGDVGNIGPFVSVIGPGHNSCVIGYIGSGDCLRANNTVFPSSDTFDTLAGFAAKFDGFTIDGSLSSAGACGFHAGDTEGCTVGDDFWVTNFSGGSIATPTTASKGIWWDNAVSWTENVRARANLYNNTIGVYFSVTTGDLSFMYSSHEYKVYGWPNQYGVMLDNGANFDAGSMILRGNFKSSSSANVGAALAFGTSASANNRIADSRLDIQCEVNSGISGGSNRPYTIKQTSAFYTISRTQGIWNFGNTWTASNLNTAFPLSHIGLINGDTTLAGMQKPFTPASYPWQVNNLLGWAGDIASAASSGQAPANQSVVMTKVMVPADVTINNILAYVTNVGATLTAGQNLAGIYSSGGVLLGQTADQATNWTSTGEKTMALTAPVSITGGQGVFIWVAFLVNGTTPPTFLKMPSSDQNIGLTAAQFRAAKWGGTFTAFPTPLSPLSSILSTFHYWAGIS